MNSNLHEEPTQSSAGEAETANRSTAPAPECVISDALFLKDCGREGPSVVALELDGEPVFPLLNFHWNKHTGRSTRKFPLLGQMSVTLVEFR